MKVKKTIKNLTDRLKRYKKKEHRMNEALSKSQEEQVQYISKISELEATVANLSASQVSHLKAVLQEKEVHASNLEEQVSSVQKELQNRIERIKELERELKQQHSDENYIKNYNKNENANVIGGDDEMKGNAQEEIANLKEQLKAALEEVKEWEKVADRKDQDKEALEEANRELKDELTEKAQTIEQLQQEMDNLQRKLEQKEEVLTLLTSQLSEKESLLASQQLQLDTLDMSKALEATSDLLLESVVGEANDEVGSTHDRGSSSSAIGLDSSEKSLEKEKVKEKEKEKEEEVAKLKKKIARLMEQKTAIADRFEEMIRTTQQMEKAEKQEMKKLQDDIGNLRSALKQKEDEVRVLNNIVDALREQENDHKRELQELAQLEEIKRELFDSTALAIKLNLSMRGVQSTIPVGALYEQMIKEGVNYKEWNAWIHTKLSASHEKKEAIRKSAAYRNNNNRNN
jgi:chromosome segregation ATPase